MYFHAKQFALQSGLTVFSGFLSVCYNRKLENIVDEVRNWSVNTLLPELKS